MCSFRSAQPWSYGGPDPMPFLAAAGMARRLAAVTIAEARDWPQHAAYLNREAPQAPGGAVSRQRAAPRRPETAMSKAPLAHDVRIAAEVRDQIEAAGIAADDEDFGKLLEAECDLPDRIRRTWRAARYAEALAAGTKKLKADLAETQKRHEARAERLKGIVSWAMQEAGVSKLEAPDFVLSVITGGKAPLVIEGLPEDLPDDLVRISREPNREAIRAALDEGREVPGARFGNAAPYVTARTR